MRTYHGEIKAVDETDRKIVRDFNLPTGQTDFMLTGYWEGYGGKQIGSYALKDEYLAWENGEGEYPRVQFTRGKHGFYIETVD